MYYYRHGEVIFASLLPDLPLEPAKRPSAGTPSLFLIDRDPIRSRSSFCVSDPRQLTAETEDVTWLDPSRMGGLYQGARHASAKPPAGESAGGRGCGQHPFDGAEAPGGRLY